MADRYAWVCCRCGLEIYTAHDELPTTWGTVELDYPYGEGGRKSFLGHVCPKCVQSLRRLFKIP
jgi:hypothetical protein